MQSINTGDKIVVCVGDYHFLGKHGLLHHFENLGYDIKIFDEEGYLYSFHGLSGNTIWQNAKLDDSNTIGSIETNFQDVTHEEEFRYTNLNTTVIDLDASLVLGSDAVDSSK